MPLTSHQVLWAWALPATMAMLMALAGGFIFREKTASPALLAIAGGIVVAFSPLMERSLLWPWTKGYVVRAEAIDRLVVASIVLAIVMAILSHIRVLKLLYWLVLIAVPFCVIAYVFKVLPLRTMPSARLIQWTGIAGAAATIVAAAVEFVARKRGTASACWILGPTCAAAAAVLMMSGEMNLGKLATVLAFLVAGFCVAGLLRRNATIAGGAAALVVAMIAALIAYGYFDQLADDGLPIRNVGLLAAGPILSMLVEILPTRKWKPWKADLLRFGLTLLPLLVAVALAKMQFDRDSASPYGM